MAKEVSHRKVSRLSFPPFLPPRLPPPSSPEKNGPVRGVAGAEQAREEEEEGEHGECDDAEQENFEIEIPWRHAIGAEQVEGAIHRASGVRFGHGWQWWRWLSPMRRER